MLFFLTPIWTDFSPSTLHATWVKYRCLFAGHLKCIRLKVHSLHPLPRWKSIVPKGANNPKLGFPIHTFKAVFCQQNSNRFPVKF